MNARTALLAAVLAAGIFVPGVSRAAVPVPGAPEEHPIALVGGTVHTVSGAEIPNGTVVFDRGKITAVGADVPVPAAADRVDVRGKDVYPSLIDSYSILGLAEFESVRSSLDYNEVGQITPNVHAETAVNPESESIPVTRSNGVLLALVAPRGEFLRGTSALMMLDGWTWSDMELKAPIALHIAWPPMVITATPGAKDQEEQQRKARDKALRSIYDSFDQARAYWTAKKAAAEHGTTFHGNDQRWEAMIPVLEGKVPVIIEAGEIQQIEAAVAFADQQKVRMILYGGYDAPRCAGLLRDRSIPVIVNIVHRLPARRYEAYDTPFTVAERLRGNGIRYCIANGGGYWNERNLPYEAATAAAYGLPRADALKAITLYPAQILGVSDRVGSLEVGKDATLFVSDGDILEVSSHVESAYIQGRKVDLDDKQKALWTKYREKYRRIETASGSSGGSGGTSSGR